MWQIRSCRYRGSFDQTRVRQETRINPEHCCRRTRPTEHASVYARLRSVHSQTRSLTVVFADDACEMKQLYGAVSADACYAMTAHGTTMKLEESCVCNLVHSGAYPPCQVLVTPSLEMRTGRSVNRSVALVMADYVPDETGVKGSAERSRLFVKPMRI